MATKIVTKNSSTASAVPTASDLVQGELAVNVADKRLFTEDNGGAIVELGTNPSGNVTFQDNGKAIFGAGSDLQIYHDGNNSFVADEGTGALVLQSNGSFTLIQNSSGVANARFDSAGATSLRYNGAEKLATTSTGIDVTGNLQATGYLAVDGASGNTGAGTDRWIGGDGTAGTWFYNVPTGSNHYFAVNNANKLAINSTGIDVTGTVTADGLTVDGSTAINNPSSQQITFSRTGSSVGSGTIGADVAQAMGIWDTDNNKVAAFYQNQDVAFYEDTGTTAKLFWDASAESLGIGTSSPAYELDVKSSGEADIRIDSATGNDGALRFAENGTNVFTMYHDAANSALAFYDNANTSERLRIDASGNVGIGNSSPSSFNYLSTSPHLVVGGGSSDAGVTFYSSTNGYGRLAFADGTDSTEQYRGLIQYYHSDNSMQFYTGSDERMRIDSSGNVKINAAGSLLIRDDGTFIKEAGGLQIGNTSGTGTTRPIMFYTESAERMRIDSSGLVSIKNTTAPTLRIENTDTGLSANETIGDIDFYQNDPSGTGVGVVGKIRSINSSGFQGEAGLAFHTGTASGLTERMRIDASGNVGIGTSGLYSGTPTLKGKLRLSKHSVTQDGGLEFVATDFSNGYGWRVQSNDYGSGDTRLSFFSRSNSASWTERVKFNENGSAYNSTGTWGSLSDGTLKENVRPSTSQWEDIKALNIVNYSFIEDSLDSPDKIGVIAQELEESGMEGLVETGGDGIKTVKYSVMHTKALKALQEAMVRIETLEVRITELENN